MVFNSTTSEEFFGGGGFFVDDDFFVLRQDKIIFLKVYLRPMLIIFRTIQNFRELFIPAKKTRERKS